MSKRLNYTIVVTGPVYGTQSAYCAYQFVTTLLTQTSHHIRSIFFYSEGVYNGNYYNDPANDEFDLTQAWQTLNRRYNISLNICIAAGQRRGVTENNFAEGFELVGLGQLSESIAESDRVIQF